MAKTGEKKSGMMGVILALLAVTLAACGAGAGLAFLLPLGEAPKPVAEAQPTEAPAVAEAETAEAEGPEDLVVQPMPPVVTNLAAGPDWIRFEASLLIKAEAKAEAEVLAAQSTAAIQAFLKTLTIGQIEGASGLAALKEDLRDLLATTGEGKISGIAIQTLVVE